MKSLFPVLFLLVSLNGRFICGVTSTDASQITEADQFHLQGKVTKNSEAENFKLEGTLEKSQHNLQESEKQELLLPSQPVIGDPPFLDTLQVSAELSTTAEAVVFPSADTVVELQQRVKSQLQNEKGNDSNPVFSSVEQENQEYVVHAEPKLEVQPIVEETARTEVNESQSLRKSSREETKKTAPQHEDIPSFSEWSQKQLAEAEKKKSDQNETSEKFPKARGKFRNKNYASPDCGAKIVASNPESLSSFAVLSSLKDEYMLNYCTNRIWFVVELCEAIQAKQLDLANFELFSSSPKHFSVFVSHRFPTRDWSNVGKFTAEDTRDVQTFNLHPYLFGKYVKVELHSHYGKEQFCPISWVGVYGTSEYEVLAKEDERHLLPDEDEQYEEDLFVGHRRDSPKNLFSSATDAVLSIVKKATAPFMKTETNDTKSEVPETTSGSKFASCISPRYIVVCNNCSQSFYDEVFHVLSCRYLRLNGLLSSGFVKRTLIDGDACTALGLEFASLRTGAPFPSNFLENPRQEVSYLTVMLSESAVAALCNVLAVLENKVVVNATAESGGALLNVTEKADACEVNSSKFEIPVAVEPSRSREGDCLSPFSSLPTKTSLFVDIFGSREPFDRKIEPTKTLTEDEVKRLPPSAQYSESSTREVAEEKSTHSGSGYVTSTATVGRERSETEGLSTEQKITFVETKGEPEKEAEVESKNGNSTNGDTTLESIISDLNAIEKAVESPSSSVAPSASNLPAESIFLRLANRIKNLEINMSLSSTYLEELSKRYKVQLDLLSKTLNLTVQKMEEQSKAEEEREKQKEKEIMSLRMQLANLSRDVSALLRERNSWRPRASSISQHMLFTSVEILLVWCVFTYWKRSSERSRSPPERLDPTKRVAKKWKRRNSLEGVKGHETPRGRARRPSDEALEIALSRSGREDIFKVEKKKRRRKKDSKCSINVIQVKRKRSDAVAGENGENGEEGSNPSSISEEIQAPELISSSEIEITNRFAPIASPLSPAKSSNSVSKALQSLSGPAFMKTALAARNSRLKSASEKESSQEDSLSLKQGHDHAKKERKSSNGLKKYMKKFF